MAPPPAKGGRPSAADPRSRLEDPPLMLAPCGRPWQRLCAAACTLWACVALAPRVWSATNDAPALLDPMGGEQPVLRLINPGPRVALLSQESVRGETPHGGGAELLVVQAPAGESAQLSYRIPPAPVLPSPSPDRGYSAGTW